MTLLVSHDRLLTTFFSRLTLLRYTERLTSKRRYAEAAKVLVEYGQDLPAAVDALCEGNLFAEAVRLVSPLPCLPTLWRRR